MAVDVVGLVPGLPVNDAAIDEAGWLNILHRLVGAGLLRWRDVGALTLGHLNPPQMGTSLAHEGFQERYGKGTTMAQVWPWAYQQDGCCRTCSSRLELQADHVIPKEFVRDASESVVSGPGDLTDATVVEAAVRTALDALLLLLADAASIPTVLKDGLVADLVAKIVGGERDPKKLSYVADNLDNIVLRCRRCNVARRPSHANAGVAHLTTEAALMWILLTFRPRSLPDYITMCRLYGMTMADIRMREGWAMTHWVQAVQGVAYRMEEDHDQCSVVRCADGALVRHWAGEQPAGSNELFGGVLPTDEIAVVYVSAPDASGRCTVAYWRQSVRDLPFSHYFPGSPSHLAFSFTPPNREKNTQIKYKPRPPYGAAVVGATLLAVNQSVEVRLQIPTGTYDRSVDVSTSRGKKIATLAETRANRLTVTFTLT